MSLLVFAYTMFSLFYMCIIQEWIMCEQADCSMSMIISDSFGPNRLQAESLLETFTTKVGIKIEVRFRIHGLLLA